jgi:hypothetical protein
MDWIAARGSTQPGWWVELRNAAGHVDAPVGMVQQSVVTAAECHTVGEAGSSSLGPMNNVMNVAPAGRDSTARKGAAAVAQDHRTANRCRHDAAGTPDVERFTTEPSTTGMISASQAMRRAVSALIGPPSAINAEPMRPWSTGKLTVTTTCGALATFGGKFPAVQGALGQVDKSVGVALGCGAQVDFDVGGGSRRGQRAQRRPQDFGGFPVEPSAQLIAAVTVMPTQMAAGLRLVLRRPAVLIEVGQHPSAQHCQLARIQNAGLPGQLGLNLHALLGVDMRRDAHHDGANHRHIRRADGMLATATAVSGSRDSNDAPSSPRVGRTSAAASTRARASLRGTRATARTSSAVDPYPLAVAIPRESISPTTANICAHVACNGVSSAPRSASSCSSLLCHTGATDIARL